MKITRKRGDTYGDLFVIVSSTTEGPLNISGYTFLLTLDTEKFPTNNATNIYQLAGTILSAEGGTVEFAPSAGQADRLGAYYYDIQMIDGAGRKRTITSGQYFYKQDITK